MKWNLIVFLLQIKISKKISCTGRVLVIAGSAIGTVILKHTHVNFFRGIKAN